MESSCQLPCRWNVPNAAHPFRRGNPTVRNATSILILYTDLLFRQRLEEALTPPPAAPSSMEELIPRLGDSLVAQKIITAATTCSRR